MPELSQEDNKDGNYHSRRSTCMVHLIDCQADVGHLPTDICPPWGLDPTLNDSPNLTGGSRPAR